MFWFKISIAFQVLDSSYDCRKHEIDDNVDRNKITNNKASETNNNLKKSLEILSAKKLFEYKVSNFQWKCV